MKNVNTNSNRAQLILVAITAASILVGCGTEQETNSEVEIQTQPGMIASAIEQGNDTLYDGTADIEAPAAIDVESFFQPTTESDDQRHEFIQPPNLEGLIPPGIETPEEELEEEIMEEEVEELPPFNNGCGTVQDWKLMGHHTCDSVSLTLNQSEYHGECDGGFTSSKIVCSVEVSPSETAIKTFESMTIGGAGTCKPISALKSAALIFCSSEKFQSGKGLQPCDGGIEANEDSYRVFLFSCLR